MAAEATERLRGHFRRSLDPAVTTTLVDQGNTGHYRQRQLRDPLQFCHLSLLPDVSHSAPCQGPFDHHAWASQGPGRFEANLRDNAASSVIWT